MRRLAISCLTGALLLICSPARAGRGTMAPKDAPPDVVERAKAYIEGVVGAEYGAENYALVDQPALYRANRDQYVLGFRYRTLLGIGDFDPVVYVTVPSDPSSKPFGCVARIRDGRVVEPQISRDDALRIAREHTPALAERTTVHVMFLKPSGQHCDQPWIWQISVPGRSTSEGCHEVFDTSVDASSGEASLKLAGEVCNFGEPPAPGTGEPGRPAGEWAVMEPDTHGQAPAIPSAEPGSVVH